jgi:hypothetical protein
MGVTCGFPGQTGATIDAWDSAARMRPDEAPRNGAALLSFLFGAGAVALAVARMLPLDTVWVSVACVIALIFGARALSRRRKVAGTIVWAPVAGILLGVAATAAVFLGGPVSSFVGAAFPQPAGSIAATTSVSAPENSLVPLVFPLNASLSSQEIGAQTLATAINRMYASGKATLAPDGAWPASVSMSGSTVVSSTGSRIATLPAGETATYALSADKSSYRLTVAAQNPSELATYSSGLNAFSFSCTTKDTNCTPAN